jgi:hypothetical protein
VATLREQNTYHANRARVLVDGVRVGEAVNVNVNESGGTAPVRVVGQVEAVEHIHNAYDTQVQVGKLMWRTGRLSKFDLGNGLLAIPPFDIEGYDEVTNEVLFVARDCTIATRGLSISANQPIQSNVSLMAIRVEKGGGASSTPFEESNLA